MGGCGVVVDMRLPGVVLLFAILTVVMAVRQLSMVVGVCVPVNAVLHIATGDHVMRNVPMIVLMGRCGVRVLGRSPCALGELLLGHCSASPFASSLRPVE
jgi:hypothetical protein